MDSNLTIYFDMEGVLVKYDRNGYITTDEQPVAPFLMPWGRFFWPKNRPEETSPWLAISLY